MIYMCIKWRNVLVLRTGLLRLHVISRVCRRHDTVFPLSPRPGEYGTAVDVWAAGCILAELLVRQWQCHARASRQEGPLFGAARPFRPRTLEPEPGASH